MAETQLTAQIAPIQNRGTFLWTVISKTKNRWFYFGFLIWSYDVNHRLELCKFFKFFVQRIINSNCSLFQFFLSLCLSKIQIWGICTYISIPFCNPRNPYSYTWMSPRQSVKSRIYWFRLTTISSCNARNAVIQWTEDVFMSTLHWPPCHGWIYFIFCISIDGGQWPFKFKLS